MFKFNILAKFILIFFMVSCSSVENNSFGKEREEKITELKEDCSFATVDYDRTGQPLYICYKDGTSIKRQKVVDDTNQEKIDSPETPTVD
tara:strand:- start:3955 stop:4224 length:270 start_codon:yes stop_codon:yes gene_type:complete